MYGRLFAHAVFTVSLSLMRYAILMGRGEGVLFLFAKLIINEDGRYTSGDALMNMP